MLTAVNSLMRHAYVEILTLQDYHSNRWKDLGFTVLKKCRSDPEVDAEYLCASVKSVQCLGAVSWWSFLSR